MLHWEEELKLKKGKGGDASVFSTTGAVADDCLEGNVSIPGGWGTWRSPSLAESPAVSPGAGCKRQCCKK